MNKQADIFNLLKHGTSFRGADKEKAINKPKDTKNRSKSSNQQKQTGEAPNKHIPDSDSEIEEEGFFLPEGGVEKIDEDQVNETIKARNRRRDRMNKILHQYKIKHEGEDVPYPVSNFSKIKKRYGLNDALMQNMKKSGCEKPTAVQMQSIPILMNNRNLLSVAPTGSGKTLAYLIPLYCHLKQHEKGGVRAVIFVPTMELGEQILKEFLFYNLNIKNFLKVKFIHKMNIGTKSFTEQLEHTDVIIATPVKFIQAFQEVQDKIMTIKYAVFDEADKYFELGFLDQVNTILEFLKNNNSITYGWFSATINSVIEDILKNFLKDPVKVMIGGRNNVLATIKQKLTYTGNEFGKLVEIRRMIHEGDIDPPVLVFVQSKERAMELYEEIGTEKIKLGVIHADRKPAEREETILKFRIGEIWMLITTDLMARGIDFKGVNLVINYDFPTSAISYIHRVGRTGRANREGRAVTFFTDFDKPLLKTLGNTLKSSGLDVPDWIMKLKKAGKEYRKRVEQIPIKRDHISTSMENQADPRYVREVKKVNAMWHKTIKKMKKNPENVNEGENEWVTVGDQQDEDEWTKVENGDEEEEYADEE